MHVGEEEYSRSGDRGRERLMCAALLNAKAGLGADKLCTEQFTLARTFR